MSHIFTDDGKQWGLIPELPEKPAMKNPGVSVQRLYDKALSEAKANALPIVNPEVAVWPATRDYYFHEYLKIEINRVELGKLYEWPGTWEKVRYSIEEDSTAVGVAAKLIAPQQPQSEKTDKHVYETSKRNKVLDEAIKEVWKLYDCEIQTKEGVIHAVTKVLESLKIIHL